VPASSVKDDLRLSLTLTNGLCYITASLPVTHKPKIKLQLTLAGSHPAVNLLLIIRETLKTADKSNLLLFTEWFEQLLRPVAKVGVGAARRPPPASKRHFSADYSSANILNIICLRNKISKIE